MNCPQCKELLVEYTEGLLEETQTASIKEHLGNCPQCQAEFDELNALQQRLNQRSENFQQVNLENSVMNRILRETKQQLKRTRQDTRHVQIWRFIMNAKLTKLAAAAAIILVAALLITFFDRTTQLAYALEHTIEASHSVRYLHIKDYKEGMEEPKEFWLEFDERSQIKNIRAHMPEWESPADGEKVTVWQEGKAKVWNKKKNTLVILNEQRFANEMSKVVQAFDPKQAVQNFANLEKQGLVEIKINQPSKKSEPIIITSTNSQEVKDLGYKIDRTILFVDQATKLVNAMEHYVLNNNNEYELLGWTEFFDYNQQIAPEMFALDDVPSDVIRLDWTIGNVGIEQGNLSDKEIAKEAVRQFYEALIAKDYAKAGQIYSGIPAAMIQKRWQGTNVLKIVSIDEPIPHPTPGVGGFQVHCEIEIEKDGVKSILKPYGPGVRKVYGRSNRWNIHGGVK